MYRNKHFYINLVDILEEAMIAEGISGVENNVEIEDGELQDSSSSSSGSTSSDSSSSSEDEGMYIKIKFIFRKYIYIYIYLDEKVVEMDQVECVENVEMEENRGETPELESVDDLLAGSDSEDEQQAPFILPRMFVHRPEGKYRGITQDSFERNCQKVWKFYFHNNPLPPAPIKGDY